MGLDVRAGQDLAPAAGGEDNVEGRQRRRRSQRAFPRKGELRRHGGGGSGTVMSPCSIESTRMRRQFRCTRASEMTSRSLYRAISCLSVAISARQAAICSDAT